MSERKQERGFLSLAARAIGVHPSYFSRAVQQENNLTPDQGFALAKWLGLSEFETECLSLLIQRDRASSHLYKTDLTQKIQLLRERYEDLGRNFLTQANPNSIEGVYYSSWIYSAVHILMTIPEINTVAKIAKSIGANQRDVQKALEVLESMQLVKKSGERWSLTNSKVFLSNRNALSNCYHSAWSSRLDSQLSVLDSSNTSNHVRYTGVHSLSQADWAALKKQIRAFSNSVEKTVTPSNEETLIVIRLDAAEVI